jgi:hypothetical protein
MEGEVAYLRCYMYPCISFQGLRKIIQKASVTIGGVPAEIRTGTFLNTCPQNYPYISPLGNLIAN